MSENKIFSGLRVVDLASFIVGPAATTVLSDFGADVVKVEPPGFGDLIASFTALHQIRHAISTMTGS
jgi:crotonobetainyl-CoA:carnitine CoA-transferase CaiB-like acyl-CoA transferase